MTPKSLVLAAGVLTLFAGPALAHHSFAMFANDKTVEYKGTVKQLEWVNPHSWLHIVVMNSAGKPEEWAFEMGSPGMMASRGWKKDSVKVGQIVTVTAHPMKDPQAHGGSEMAVKLPDGTMLGNGRPTKPNSGPYF